MSNNVSLNASVRAILNGLQSTTATMDVVQNRLATGKKVSSAIDDPSAFFTAKSLYNRSSDLAALKDNITQAMNTVKAATEGLTGIEKILTQMKGLAEQAKSSATAAERGKYGDQYDALRTELDNLAKDASFNGVNLIKGTPNDLTVTFNEDASATYTIDGIASDSAGLSVTANNAWNNATLATGLSNIEGDLTKINDALVTVRTSSSTLGTSASLLKIRSDFTQTMVDTLKAGGDNLTNADLNEESASLLALQTRQQLAITSLTMANQSSQAVLRLFG
jgi:flagellin-like hook-associated protein FlgL